MKRQILLSLFSVLLIAGFFALPRNYGWSKTLVGYYSDFSFQRQHMDEATRWRRRFGSNYTLSRVISDSMRLRNLPDSTELLMPPTAYFTLRGVNYQVPEPAVFYYFTGRKTVWVTSDSSFKLKWMLVVKDKAISLDSVIDFNASRDSIISWRKLGVSLQ